MSVSTPAFETASASLSAAALASVQSKLHSRSILTSDWTYPVPLAQHGATRGLMQSQHRLVDS